MVIVLSSPVLGSRPCPAASHGRGRPLDVSISWWVVGNSPTLVSRLDVFDIHRRRTPSTS